MDYYKNISSERKAKEEQREKMLENKAKEVEEEQRKIEEPIWVEQKKLTAKCAQQFYHLQLYCEQMARELKKET